MTKRLDAIGITAFRRTKTAMNEWRILMLALAGIATNVMIVNYDPVDRVEVEAAYESELAQALETAHQQIALKEQFQILAMR